MFKDKEHQTSSLSEGKCDAFIKEEKADKIIEYTSKYLVKGKSIFIGNVHL
jgi:hypothetical protein